MPADGRVLWGNHRKAAPGEKRKVTWWVDAGSSGGGGKEIPCRQAGRQTGGPGARPAGAAFGSGKYLLFRARGILNPGGGDFQVSGAARGGVQKLDFTRVRAGVRFLGLIESRVWGGGRKKQNRISLIRWKAPESRFWREKKKGTQIVGAAGTDFLLPSHDGKERKGGGPGGAAPQRASCPRILDNVKALFLYSCFVFFASFCAVKQRPRSCFGRGAEIGAYFISPVVRPFVRFCLCGLCARAGGVEFFFFFPSTSTLYVARGW